MEEEGGAPCLEVTNGRTDEESQFEAGVTVCVNSQVFRSLSLTF